MISQSFCNPSYNSVSGYQNLGFQAETNFSISSLFTYNDLRSNIETAKMSINFSTIKTGAQDLKTDLTNGSRVLATKALQTLHDALQSTQQAQTNRDQLWTDLRIAAYELSEARPSMSAAITSALVQALNAIRRSDGDAKSVLTREIAERRRTGEQIAEHFVDFLKEYGKETSRHASSAPLNILTLSLSSTLRECLFQAIRKMENARFNVRILESRPNCEGADFAVSLLKEFPTEARDKRLLVEVAPEAYICAIARDVDILLLGADRISANGDVSNKVGSFMSALCAKSVSPFVRVVVVSDSDKIARSGSDIGNSEESGPSKELMSAWKEETRDAAVRLERSSSLRICNTYFEWVPMNFIDLYLTEEGSMHLPEVAEKSKEKGRLEDELFDPQIRSLAKD